MDVGLTCTAGLMWLSTIIGGRLDAIAGFHRPLMVASAVMCVWCLARRRINRVAMTITTIALGMVGGSWSWQSLPEVRTGHCEGVVTLRTDPTPMGRGSSVVLEMGSLRLKASAFGPPGWRLERRLAGERVWVAGECGPLSGEFARRDAVNHIVGRISVTAVSEQFDEGSALVRSVNRLRRAMVEGVSDMPSGLRGLFTGLVIGDDRAQSRSMVGDFRASGLSHLCAVSGQNVAYLLALASPLSRRLSRTFRWWVTMGLLAWFVVLTRGEPSVLRAAFMGAMVATNSALGIGMNARSVLALTVIGLLTFDPMLAWSVGFALSVGATAGLAWLSSRLLRLVGGRGVLAATLSAQLGTMPITLAVFGHVSVIALVANPLTIATAGAVMMVGLPCALIGGIHPWATTVASAVMTVPVAWIAGVAHLAASMSPPGPCNMVGWMLVAAWLAVRRAHQQGRPTDVAG